jgi:hypothetical protein
LNDPSVQPGSIQDYAGCLALPLGLVISFAGWFAYGSQSQTLHPSAFIGFVWGPLLAALGLACFFFQNLKKTTFVVFAVTILTFWVLNEYSDEIDRYLMTDTSSR